MTKASTVVGTRRASWSYVWGTMLASAVAAYFGSPTPAGAAPAAPVSSKAKELEERYERLHAEGKHAEAIVLAKRACANLQEKIGSRSLELAACLDDLAKFYDAQGTYVEEAAAYERALAIREETLGPEHPDVGENLRSLAEVYRAQGLYEEATSVAERALSIHEATLGPAHPQVALDLSILGWVYEDQGAYDDAEPFLERALAIDEKALGSEHSEVANRLNNLAVLYVRQGRHAMAEPLLKRALTIGEKTLGPEHPDVARWLGNLAVLYQHQGRYEEAESLLERALSNQEKESGPDHVNVAIVLNNLATLHQSLGAYEKAERLTKRASSSLERSLGPEHPSVATALNNLATIYRDQRKYEEAERLHLRALSIHEKALGPDHNSIAIDLTGLALLYHDQDAYERAEPLFERALAIDEKALGPRHPGIAVSINNLAMLYKDQGAYEEARPLMERALRILEDAFGPQHPRVATALYNLAALHYVQGNLETALELHHRALGIEERALTRNLLFAEESRRMAFVSTIAKRTQHRLSLHLRAAPNHRPTAELALTTLLRRKGRTLDLIAQSNAELRRSLSEEGQRTLDELGRVHARYATLEGRGLAAATELAALEKEHDRLWNELAGQSTAVQSLDHPTTIADVQNALVSNSALVELVRYAAQHDDDGVPLRRSVKAPTRYAAYLVFPDRFDWVDLGPAEPIDRHVAAFRRALQLEQAVPRDLHDAVMSPILERIGDADQLVIAPDGALDLVPFGALHDGERYLVERYDIRYVTTGRDLLERPERPLATSPVTIIANPTGADLAATELEADFLSAFFPDTLVLRHDLATETNARALGRPLVLHMATHGFFGATKHERDNPMLRSGLYLADVARIESEVDRELDDGRLTAYEISGWDLRGTQLVVLSACETGMGAIAMGEGVLGLRRAFAMAGAETQVMSLWRVGDVTTLEIMKAYYLELAKGKGRGEAMQAVQLTMLRSEDRSHPHGWAAFIVAGDDAPMSFPPGEKPHAPARATPEPNEDVRGCATTTRSHRRPPLAPLLVTFVGLAAARRRRR